jgi:hypothetical protein
VFITVAVMVVVVVVSASPTNVTAVRLVHYCQQKPRGKLNITYVVVAVDFAVTVVIFVETTRTNPAHVMALGYAAGEKTGCPFTNLHSWRCFESRSSSSGARRTRFADGCAGAASPAPGSVDSMG